MALALAVGCPPRGFHHAAAVYAYFRWADDAVDAPDRDPAEVRRFMQHQAALIRGSVPPDHPAERALRWALATPELGPRLQPPVERMAEALIYDAQRDATPIPTADLQRQVENIGDAFVGAIWVCSGAPGTPSDAALLLARAATATHMLRDRVEDQALGYSNLPREHFGATAPTDGPTLQAWLAERSAQVDGWFAKGLDDVADIQPAGTRRLVRMLGERYRKVLQGLPDGPGVQPS